MHIYILYIYCYNWGDASDKTQREDLSWQKKWYLQLQSRIYHKGYESMDSSISKKNIFQYNMLQLCLLEILFMGVTVRNSALPLQR